MSRATASLPRSIGAHAALLLYTAIALFPVVVIVVLVSLYGRERHVSTTI